MGCPMRIPLHCTVEAFAWALHNADDAHGVHHAVCHPGCDPSLISIFYNTHIYMVCLSALRQHIIDGISTRTMGERNWNI